MTSLRTLALVPCALTLSISPALAWGEIGHLRVNEAAAKGLPKQVPGYLRDKVQELSYLGPEPDRWRNRDQRELNQGAGPDHYIDLEWALEAKINPRKPPPHRHEYARKVARSRKLPDKVGYGPYRVIELCQRLEASVASLELIEDDDPHAEARRSAAKQSILYVAGVLGHYVGDLANPHHCSIHYNGWTGDNPEGFATDKGVHFRFETDFVRRVQDRIEVRVTSRARTNLDYKRAIWDMIVESNGLLRTLYRLDRDGAFAPGKEQSALAHKGATFAQARMVRGATLLRDMWTTACARGKKRARSVKIKKRLESALADLNVEDLKIEVNLNAYVKIEGKVASHAITRRARAIVDATPGVGRATVKLKVLH